MHENAPGCPGHSSVDHVCTTSLSPPKHPSCRDGPKSSKCDHGCTGLRYRVVGRRWIRGRVHRRAIRGIPGLIVVGWSDHRLIRWQFAARPAIPVERLGRCGCGKESRGCRKPTESKTESSHYVLPHHDPSRAEGLRQGVIPNCGSRVNPVLTQPPNLAGSGGLGQVCRDAVTCRFQKVCGFHGQSTELRG